MSLKKLNQFSLFDIEKFLKDKKLVIIGYQDWKDFESQNILGTKFELVITVDETEYESNDNEVISNRYEKLVVKLPKKFNNIPLNAEVRLINPKAVVYGEYRNMLSITAENIEVIAKNN